MVIGIASPILGEVGFELLAVVSLDGLGRSKAGHELFSRMFVGWVA
jgi:hypothetical protein